MVTRDMKAYVINLESRPDRMTEFKKNEFPFEVERFNAIKTEPGWHGCTLSQITILKNQEEFPFVIFEDDCVLLHSWDTVEKAMKQLPENWDALWLGATLFRPLERYSENLFRLKHGLCAHAIIYNSPVMIDYILKNYESYFMNSQQRDTLDVFYLHVQEIFNCFITYPLIATQSTGYSDIENMEINYTQIIDYYNVNTAS